MRFCICLAALAIATASADQLVLEEGSASFLMDTSKDSASTLETSEGPDLGSGSSLSASGGSAPNLDTLLVIERDVSFFSSYLRESKSLYARILTPIGALNTTIFAPSDKAIQSLTRKPHQGPEEKGEVADEAEDEKRNAAYLEEWSASHLVGGEVLLDELPSTADTLADGRKISFEKGEDGKSGWQNAVLQPGRAKILSRLQASDGVIYVLDAVLQF